MYKHLYSHFRASLTKVAYSKDWVPDTTSQSKDRSACIHTGKVITDDIDLNITNKNNQTTAVHYIHPLLTTTFHCYPRLFQFYSEPTKQQDREHRSSSEPSHEVGCVHQELVPEWILGSGGAGAALLSLLVRRVLWGRNWLQLLFWRASAVCCTYIGCLPL